VEEDRRRIGEDKLLEAIKTNKPPGRTVLDPIG